MPRHKLKYDQQKAVNESIERELFQFLSWIQEVTDEENNVKPFYFQHEVWSNGRIGLVGNWINPQSSKFIRHFVGP